MQGYAQKKVGLVINSFAVGPKAESGRGGRLWSSPAGVTAIVLHGPEPALVDRELVVLRKRCDRVT